MGLHTAHRWTGARPNCNCWPSVKRTRKISSSSITCLFLKSYCTSWWHSFDRSAYGIIESSDFIVETVFSSHHQSVHSHACSTQREQYDQLLDYKSCWQICCRRCWYFYISATTRLWSNAFRTWRDFSSFCCISVGEFSWNIISVDVNSLRNIPWELPCWFWLQFAPNLVRTQYWNGIHGLCRQMHWIPGLPLPHHVGRVSPTCTVLGNECIIPGLGATNAILG